MLYKCYIAFILSDMGRKPRTEEGETVFSQMAQVREQSGMSRQELADLVGIHYQTVGYLERGEYSPSLVLALRIAAALDLSVEKLFSLTPFETQA
jgi:putative transcriptional regulator